MNPIAKLGVTTTYLLILFGVLGQQANAATCSTATVAGDWGFTLTGTVILPSGPIPLAAVLRGTADVDGNVVGIEARNLGGSYADETFRGKWIVGPECVATATVEFKENGQLVRTSVLTVVFDNNSKQARMVQKSLTLPNGAELPVIATVEGAKH
jgi:hypothetical protein